MFSGIVSRTGTATRVGARGGPLLVTARNFAPEPGESVSVDGVCLTLEAVRGDTLHFFVGEETARRCVFHRVVNLERAVRASDRLGAHVVTGHADGTARVTGVTRRGGSVTLVVSPDVPGRVVERGGVALNGVGLTVGSVRGDRFSVHLVPETLRRTNLHACRAGTLLNVEYDAALKRTTSLGAEGRSARTALIARRL